MLKNMIVDIGGVILDDSNEVLEKFLNKSEKEIKNLSKMVYGNKTGKSVYWEKSAKRCICKN